MQSKISQADQNSDRSFIEQARRAQIMRCVAEVIASEGFAAATMARIARAAGVSAGVISYYFDAKDDLIAEFTAQVFEMGSRFIRPRLAGKSDPADLLEAFIRASCDFIASARAEVTALTHINRAGRRADGSARTPPEALLPREEGVDEILSRGQASGAFRTFSIPVMRTTLIEALDAIAPALAADPDLDIGQYREELVELFMRAVLAQPDRRPSCPTS